MEQFSDDFRFSHLHVKEKSGARSVATFNTGFVHVQGMDIARPRYWYAVAGLLIDGETALVIPDVGLEEMSDADMLAAIRAGMDFARLTQVEAEVQDYDTRLPYSMEAEDLTLEKFREVYAREYRNLYRYTHRSDLIAEQYAKIKPFWEGTNEDAGFIYCLHDQMGHFKLGLTKHLTQRIKQLSTQPPFKLTLICAFRVVNAAQFEEMLHQKYAEFRLNGEWFQLSPPQLDDFINRYAGKKYITEDDLEALQNSNGQRLLPGGDYNY